MHMQNIQVAKVFTRATISLSETYALMQQEAVTLLEARSGDGSLPEEEGVDEDAEDEADEAEAEDAARALLGLPKTVKGILAGAEYILSIDVFDGSSQSLLAGLAEGSQRYLGQNACTGHA